MMQTRNRITEYYSAAKNEQCNWCGRRLPQQGVYYVGRLRVCRECSHDHYGDDTKHELLHVAACIMITGSLLVLIWYAISSFWN